MNRRIIYPVLAFIILQGAVLSAITLWIIGYVVEKSQYDEIVEIAKSTYTNIEATRHGFALMLVGIILLGVVFLVATLAFIGWLKERLLQRQRADFFSSFSHELMTPISCIKINLEAISKNNKQEDRLSDEQKNKLIAAAIAESNRLEITIKNIIETTRAEHKHLWLRKSTIDLKTFLMEWAKSATSNFPDVTLVADLPIKEVFSDIDTRYFNIALENILQNAIKYSPEKKIIKISLITTNHKAILVIEDQGAGIEREKLKKVFKMFYRGDTMKSQGVGLGLFLTKTIVNLHHGKIHMESGGPGKGSKFVISLSRKDTAA